MCCEHGIRGKYLREYLSKRVAAQELQLLTFPTSEFLSIFGSSTLCWYNGNGGLVHWLSAERYLRGKPRTEAAVAWEGQVRKPFQYGTFSTGSMVSRMQPDEFQSQPRLVSYDE
jgi:hypothetical protein